jgi:hypothetical protein
MTCGIFQKRAEVSNLFIQINTLAVTRDLNGKHKQMAVVKIQQV